MSVAKHVYGNDGPAAGEKVLLRRRGPDLWRMEFARWAGETQVRWKALAMLQLHAHCNWSLQMIGLAFGQHRGRVCRLMQDARRRIVAHSEAASEAITVSAPQPAATPGGHVYLNAADRERLGTVAAEYRLSPAAALRKCLAESETFRGEPT